MIPNKIYATTYDGMYPEGDGPDRGTVMPFRLVLAQRDKNCKPTTGIIRYEAKDIPEYSRKGLGTTTAGSYADGAEERKIKELAPH